jgi:hypothetical protein
VCPACGAELGAVVFDNEEDALDAFRDAADAARVAHRNAAEAAVAAHAEPVAVVPRREPPRLMLWEPVSDPELYGASIPFEVLEMRPVLAWPWPWRRDHE